MDVSTDHAELNARVAVVTGAAGGVGRAVVERLLRSGALVAALDVDTDGLDQLGRVLGDSHLETHGCNVSERDDVARVVASVESTLGPPTLLANVAGVLELNDATQVTDAQWQRSFAVNTLGVVYSCQAVVPHMLRAKEGAIVSVSSNAASTPRTHFAAYAASKAAANMYTRCLGLELAGSGIRCNLVSPGTTRTAMLAPLFASTDHLRQSIDGDLGQFRCGIPLRRIAEPADVAEAVFFLLSNRSRHITLHDLRVDGGATLGTG